MCPANICFVHLARQEIALQKLQNDSIRDPIAIQAKAVSSWLGFAAIAHLHAVVGPCWVTDASTKGLRHRCSIGCFQSTFRVNVELSERNFLTQWNLLAFVVLDWDLLGLVATTPNDEVCLVDMLLLILWCLGLDQLYARLRS
jgi:hypothetical protein